MGWRGPTTNRQLAVWMAWLPWESTRLEFVKPKPRVPEELKSWILTPETIAGIRKKGMAAKVAGK